MALLGIGCHPVSLAVYHKHHVTLQIRDVIVDGAAGAHGVGHGVWRSALVIPEVQDFRGPVPRDRLPQQLPAGVDVLP